MIEQVKASAGSGKTYALTERFVRLLFGARERDLPAACGGPGGPEYGWPEIMAVTFTNKAAAEMKERVVGALKARALGREDTPCGDDPPERAARWLERVLRHYHQLNIGTIDSLLARIMRIFALEAGLPPDFEPVFDAAELFEEALDRIVERAEAADGEDRALLAGALDTMLRLEARPGFQPGQAFRKRLRELAEFRLTDRGEYVTDPHVLHAAVAPLRREFTDAARTLAPLLRGLDVSKHLLNFLDRCLAHGEGDPVPESKLIEKDGLDDCLNKASKGLSTPEQDAAYLDLQEARAAYARGRALLEAARNWAGFLRLADAAAREMELGMRGTGQLLNALCPGLAREVLGGEYGAPDAFCRLGARLRHMLVDEFQDTSRDQWAAMAPLAEECLSQGGGLYMVGDVKQAIYGWRGGDARLFDEVPADPGLTAMSEVRSRTLPDNWRSRERVVEFNNDIFGPLGDADRALDLARAMRPEAPQEAVRALADSLASAFSGARQALPPGRADGAGHVRLVRVEAGTKDELYEAVGETLHGLVEEITARRPPGDLAVLVRTNAEAAQVADWLIGWGLPVVTKNSLRLDGHPAVRQLAALLRFLDYPLDDTALWELVSGEEVFAGRAGLDRAALADWLAAQGRGPLYLRFAEDYPEAAERFLSRYLRRAGFMTPYDLVSEALDDFRILERNPGAEPFVRRFLEVVHAAERDGRQSIASFLDYWDAEGAEEKVPLPAAVPAVRVLTIHDAKGLEFPVVVVPFHHWQFKPGRRPVPFEFQGLRLLAPPRPEMGEVWHAHVNAQLFEQLALLYVAWTRPREELYCLLTTSKAYKGYPLVRALDELLAPRAFEAGADGAPAWEFGPRPQAATPGPAGAEVPAVAPTPGTPQEGAAKAAPDGAQPPDEPMAWLPRLKIHRHFSEEATPGELLTGGPAFDARTRGALIHDALDRLGAAGAPAPEEAARAAVAAHADLLPPGDEARAALAAEAADILRWALGLPDFPGWVRRGLPECPILDAEGREHRPDLLVLDPDEAVVVEYKTGAPDPAHEDQVRRYMGLLAAMPDAPPSMRGVIVYLDGRRAVEVRP